MAILDRLNNAQRQAAEIVDGPLLVLAGAGAGKTRVLTHRIAYLVEEIGVAPWNILAVTFTNKAAGEMRERVEQLVGSAAASIWMGTFHSICARLLRFEANGFGIEADFSIYDEDDRRALMRRLMKALDIAEEDLAPRALISRISRAKNAMIDPEHFAREESSPHEKRVAEIYAAYEAELRRHHAFDFDDLLVKLVQQFGRHGHILAKYQERFKFILIDEYQDTNRPQYLLSRQLAATHHNICCVGDDDQSIYQFRGADLRNILDFERDYPETRVVRLEQNYRSTGRILAAANAVILNNLDRKGKTLWTESELGEPIEVTECSTDRCEARHVVDTLRDLTWKEGYAPADAAVLYRTNAQSRALEEELQRAGMDYVIIGGVRFYERKEIKDILAYLRLLVNPADDISLLRIANTPRRGIGSVSMERMAQHARHRGISLFAALAELDRVPGLNSRSRKNLESFGALLHGLAMLKDEVDISTLGEEVFERTQYRRMLVDEGSPEAEGREQNIDQLLADMAEFGQTAEDPSLSAFLEEKSLMSPVDETTDSSNALTLMTLHSAKGLEFPLVFICGLEEGLFPTSRAVEESRDNPLAIEEERRLFYVGITRARNRLHLLRACRRFAYGNLIETESSRFLAEVPEDLTSKTELRAEWYGDRSSGSRRTPASRPGPVREGWHYELEDPASVAHLEPGIDEYVDDFLAVGKWVLHPSWGRGVIVSREGSGADMKLSIRFKGNQLKRVAVAYAQLEPA